MEVVHTCEFFIRKKNRTCLRRTKDKFCYQHAERVVSAGVIPVSSSLDSVDVPDVLSEDGDDEDDNLCAICLQDLDEALCHLEPCHHIFHSDCFSKLFKIECPLCRGIPINIPVTMMKRLDQNWLDYHPEVLTNNVTRIHDSQKMQRASDHVIQIPPPRRSRLHEWYNVFCC